jgi:hypothetical protein
MRPERELMYIRPVMTNDNAEREIAVLMLGSVRRELS